MSRFVLSLRIRTDLDRIWDYTARKWGIDQAERYLRRIAEAVDLIAETPTIGRNCDQVRERATGSIRLARMSYFTGR